jgi:hypothetical protein
MISLAGTWGNALRLPYFGLEVKLILGAQPHVTFDTAHREAAYLYKGTKLINICVCEHMLSIC